MRRITHILPMFAAALVMAVVIISCSMFESFEEEEIKINGLSLSRNSLTAELGNLVHLSAAVSPSDVQRDISLVWNYDTTIIEVSDSGNYGITFKGISEGQTNITCSYGGITATCIVTITDNANAPRSDNDTKKNTDPYIYSNTTILQMSPGGRERVYVSLYGGNAGDVDGYTWTNESPSVISIQPTGQYCVIEAKDKGYSRIKITHSKAAYPYYIGVYVYQEETNTYITTGDNIIIMDKEASDRRITVTLVNGRASSNDSGFRWEVLAEGDEAPPVSVSGNANTAIIHPERGGTCTVRVSHPDASYPLDILCRVVIIVQNIYIDTDLAVLSIDDTDAHPVTAYLKNSDGTVRNNDFRYSIDDTGVAEIVSETGNKVLVKAVANGSCKLRISHPDSEYDKEVLITVKGQTKDAGARNIRMYVSKNYIRTKIGGGQAYVEANLDGGGREKLFEWRTAHRAADGTGKVVSVDTVRNTAYITPLAEGSAVVTVSHPDSQAGLDILVKVLGEDAILEEPLYLQGSGLIKILNGAEAQYSVELTGQNKTLRDDNDIRWSVDESSITLIPDGASCTVRAPELGSGIVEAVMTITHPKADDNKLVHVITADDEETLEAIKILFTNKNYYNLNIGDEDMLGFSAEGFADGEFDISRIQWGTNNPDAVSLSVMENSPMLCRIHCRKAGDAKVTARYESLTCTFTIHVYPSGTMNVEPEAYLTTDSNYISIYQTNGTATATLHAPNLAPDKYPDITWFTADRNIIQLFPNGTECTIKGMSPGNATVIASHPDCVNTLKFYVSVCGQLPSPSQEEILNTESLSCQQNYIQAAAGDKSLLVTVNLHNLGNGAENRLCWSISEAPDTPGTAVLAAATPTGTITGDFNEDSSPVYDRKKLQYGKIALKPLNPGTATITVRHPQAKNSVTILIKVLPSGTPVEESLFFSGSNIITFTNDRPYFYSVTLNGSNIVDGDESSIAWNCDNDGFSVLANGKDAMIMSNVQGFNTARLTVSHPKVRYPKNVLVITADTAEQLESVKAVYMSATSYSVNAGEEIHVPLNFYGYDTVDDNRIVWTSSSPETATVRGGTVKGIKPGMATITATYLTSSASARVYVYPAEIPVDNDPSESSGSAEEPLRKGINLSVESDDIRIDTSRNGKTLRLSVRDDGYDGYMWLIDDEDTYETSRELTIDTASLSEGSYDITLFAFRGSICRSAFIQLRVHQ